MPIYSLYSDRSMLQPLKSKRNRSNRTKASRSALDSEMNGSSKVVDTESNQITTSNRVKIRQVARVMAKSKRSLLARIQARKLGDGGF